MKGRRHSSGSFASDVRRLERELDAFRVQRLPGPQISVWNAIPEMIPPMQHTSSSQELILVQCTPGTQSLGFVLINAVHFLNPP